VKRNSSCSFQHRGWCDSTLVDCFVLATCILIGSKRRRSTDIDLANRLQHECSGLHRGSEQKNVHAVRYIFVIILQQQRNGVGLRCLAAQQVPELSCNTASEGQRHGNKLMGARRNELPDQRGNCVLLALTGCEVFCILPLPDEASLFRASHILQI
jgi:hypothetical protein